MCLDPVTLSSLAIGTAGSVYGGYEQNQNQKRMTEARNRATEAELARQRGYGTESRGIFDNVLGTFQPGAQTAGLSAEQGNATQKFNANMPTAANVGSITTGNGPAVVNAAQGSTVAKAFARAGQRNAALGNLTGYDQQQLGNRINLGRSGGKIGEVSDFSKVSGGVSKLEQDAAYRNAFRPPSGIAELLQTAGRLGSFYGGRGGFGGKGVGDPMQLVPGGFNPSPVGTYQPPMGGTGWF